MCGYTKKHACLLTSLQLFSLGLVLAGILILSVGRHESCYPCQESPCYGTDYHYYSCDCGRYCQSKSVIVDSVYRLGISFLVMGIIGTIFGSVLACVMRRRMYNQSPPIAFVTNPQVVYTGGPGQVQYITGPVQGIPYGQPLPQNMAYGYPIQGATNGGQNQYTGQQQNPNQNPYPDQQQFQPNQYPQLPTN